MSVTEARKGDRTKRLMAMGQMAASLAHEIRNPLGSMELYCTLLKRDLSKQPDCLQLAERIHAGIKTLDRIINNCLQFARDVVPRRKTVWDPGEMFAEAKACLGPRAEQRSIELAFSDHGASPLSVDPYLVQQALLNLISNAAEAFPGTPAEGCGGAPRIEVTSDRTPENWVLTVSDNGPGIAEEEQEKIFDPFFTTKDEGTGLGLAIVHSIVSAHRGTISVNSAPGYGTSVTLVFPSQQQTEGSDHAG